MQNLVQTFFPNFIIIRWVKKVFWIIRSERGHQNAITYHTKIRTGIVLYSRNSCFSHRYHYPLIKTKMQTEWNHTYTYFVNWISNTHKCNTNHIRLKRQSGVATNAHLPTMQTSTAKNISAYQCLISCNMYDKNISAYQCQISCNMYDKNISAYQCLISCNMYDKNISAYQRLISCNIYDKNISAYQRSNIM